MSSLYLYCVLLVVSLVAPRNFASESDGVVITVVSPQRQVVVPVVVTINVDLNEGFGADLVRDDLAAYKLCYSLDGDPPLTFDLVQTSSEWAGLPVLDDPRLIPGSSHVFESWMQRSSELRGRSSRLGDAEVRLGYKKHTFTVRRQMSAHFARLSKWSADVADLVRKAENNTKVDCTKGASNSVGCRDNAVRPRFVEVGTSYFDTLAHLHAREDDGWVGTSVEPIGEYLTMLPTRRGLQKVNAMVCPWAGERTIYTFKGLREAGMDQFFAGMSSADPTFLWRSPEFRARIGLDRYRALLTTRTVRCVTFPSLLCGEDGMELESSRQIPTSSRQQRKHHHHHHEQQQELELDEQERPQAGALAECTCSNATVFAHLKVDAEGADVGIVKAAIAAALEAPAEASSCAWPWRIDFEAKHLHEAEEQTTRREPLSPLSPPASTVSSQNGKLGAGCGDSLGRGAGEYPIQFTLLGFPNGEGDEWGIWTASNSTSSGAAELDASSTSTSSSSSSSSSSSAAGATRGNEEEVGKQNPLHAREGAGESWSLNGRYVRLTSADGSEVVVDGVPAFVNVESGRWVLRFSFALGHWILAESKEADSDPGGGPGLSTQERLQTSRVGAHSDGEWVWAVPWENATAWYLPFPVSGARDRKPAGMWVRWTRVVAAQVEFGCSVGEYDRGVVPPSSSSSSPSTTTTSSRAAAAARSTSGSGSAAASPAVARVAATGETTDGKESAAPSAFVAGPELYPGAGRTEDLLLELEDLGYACSCEDLDCTCFTTPARLAIHRHHRAHYSELSTPSRLQ